jgi:hypothetical protein
MPRPSNFSSFKNHFYNTLKYKQKLLHVLRVTCPMHLSCLSALGRVTNNIPVCILLYHTGLNSCSIVRLVSLRLLTNGELKRAIKCHT